MITIPPFVVPWEVLHDPSESRCRHRRSRPGAVRGRGGGTIGDATTIERAGASDIDTLAPLFDAYRRFYGKPPDVAGARRYLAARIGTGEAVVFLAYLDGRASGFTTLYPAWSSTRMARMWVLNDLFVDPGARGQGIGAALLARARRHAGETGACEILLETAVDNPARRLYERAGYRQVEDFVYYVLDIRPGADPGE